MVYLPYPFFQINLHVATKVRCRVQCQNISKQEMRVSTTAGVNARLQVLDSANLDLTLTSKIEVPLHMEFEAFQFIANFNFLL